MMTWFSVKAGSCNTIAPYTPIPMLVHLSHVCMVLACFFATDRLALPAAELIQDRRLTTPVGIFAYMGQDLSDLVPARLGFGSPQVDGLGDELAGYGQRPGETPGLQRRLGPWCSDLLRAGLPRVRVRQESRKRRGHERRLHARLHRTGALGIHLVQAVPRLVQPDAKVALPASAIAVRHL